MSDDRIDKVRSRMEAVEDVDMGDVPVAGEGGSSEPPDRGQAPGGEDGPPEAVAAGFPLNDIGNGRRFALYHGKDVLRVPKVGWYVWDETRWARDDSADGKIPFGDGVRRLAQKVPERMLGEIEHLVYEPWERSLLDREDATTARLGELEALKPGDRTEEQNAELTDMRKMRAQIGEIKARFRDRRKRHRQHANGTGNSAKLGNMVLEAGVHLARQLEELDAPATHVNVANGIIAFTMVKEEGMSATPKMERRDHDRAALHSKIMPVEHKPKATCPKFDAFLAEVQPSAEMRRFLQRWFGLSMTTITGDQKLAFFYGHGANGKSVLVDLMARMLGDYAATAKIESLTGTNRRGGGDATPDLVPLMGARFVRASEPEQGTKLQEGTIKELTGGEPILVRALHSDFVEVHPKFKLTISGNHKPDIRGQDDGIWRRLLLVPFDVQIPPERRNPRLVEELWEKERSGILNWMLEGLRDYLEGGLQEPEAVKAATAEYRRDSDPVGAFLTECAVVSGNETDFMLSRELIEAFNFWLEDKGETRWGGRTVSNRLKDKADRWRHPGTGKTFSPGKREATGYRGIRLTDTFARRLREVQSGYGAPQGGQTGPAGQAEWEGDF